MAKKFYAVRKGKKPGIYMSWDECKEQVHGFGCAEYKSFLTRKEAENFMDNQASNGISQETADAVAYVDGSYNVNTGEFSYGVVMFFRGEELHFSQKMVDAELALMRNVAGEIKGAQAAMEFAMENGCKSLMIYHDYEGIAKWCLGDWKTNKEGTKAYKGYYDSIKDKINIHFVKVKGHSNDKYNDLADELAKAAIF